MTKREMNIGIVMGVMLIIAAFIYLPKDDAKNNNMTAKGNPVASTASKKSPVASKATSEDKDIENFDLTGLVQKIDLRHEPSEIILNRDPFSKLEPVNTELTFNDLVLSGLDWEQEQPIAIINNQVLKKGDEISGFMVFDIRQDEVILRKGQQRYVLKFNQ